MNKTNTHKKTHHGRNIKRFREMLGIKQDALAFELGDDWNQQKVSLLEQKETVEKSMLAQIASLLKIPVEAIENFDEEQAIVNIQNNYEGANSGSGTLNNNANYTDCEFNPIDKIVSLYDAKIALYERMLKEKDDMLARLEKLIK
ncbi:helix-turn-helix transcriptional regulator [Flavobacterium sp. NKUCC04_CG]|uniref:helix-turn-helix transcriptional regulator n=1 Tax=Flavobacterium sp. NKUCC04_CG TaxID=2842121 RepID=UPI001C5A7E9C|nr:helix-turn-helix transcriptional regulator [Flavobacterium sp. NKUCC04_CG]MBW3519221.1 helix-turn-helix domain-containing protein [Flavobacterium sp. NKUCC04_CG]